MSLRKKTILTILAATLLIVAIGSILAKTVLLKSYKDLELTDIQADVTHVEATLDYERENLSALTNDWAAWDDTYQFMQDKNTTYLDSNLINGTFESLSLNFILYLDTDGNVAYQKAYDLEKQQIIPVPESIGAYLHQNPDLIHLKDNQYQNGFLSVNGTPVILALSPILTSLDEGPSQGTLIFGKFIQGDLLEQIRNSTNSEISLLPFHNELIPPDSDLISIGDANSTEIYIEEIDNQNIEFYTVIKDFTEKPVFILKQVKSRTIYQQGLVSMRNMILAAILTSILAGGLLIIMLEKNLLSRLTKLTHTVTTFRVNPQSNKSIQLPGNDELSRLSIEIDQTLLHLLEAQGKLSHYLDYQKFIVGISTKFINLPINKIDQNIQLVLQTVGKQIGAESGQVVIFNAENQHELTDFYEWKTMDNFSLGNKTWNNFSRSFRWSKRKFIKGESVIFSDIAELPQSAVFEKEFCKKNSIQSAICLPLKVTDKLNGLLSFEMVTRKREWDEQIPLMLEIISNIIANAIDRKQNEIQLQRSQQFQYRLNQITKISIAKDSCNASIRALSRHLPSLIDSDRGILVLTHNEDSFAIYESGKKIPLDQEISTSIDILLEKTRKNFYVHTGNVKGDMESFQNAKLDRLGKSLIAIPLTGKNQRLGLVILADNEARQFNTQELNICQQAASQITLSIIKILSLEESQEISRELRDLRTTIAEISSELDLKKLQETILERAVKLIKGEGGVLFIFNDQTDELEFATSLNLEKPHDAATVKVGEGAVGRALQLKKTIYIRNYSTWKYRLKADHLADLKSSIATPLMIGERFLGCIGVFHRNPVSIFSKNDQHLITIFAQHASIAIDNAKLFEKIREMARTDEVTGLLNRRALKEVGEYELARSIRLNRPIAVAMVDLDNYKGINDSHNHLIGDKVLKEISRLFRENVRNIDIVGRFGGDECVIIMPETDQESAYIATERIRSVLEKQAIEVDDLKFHVTACFGISAHSDTPPSLDKIIEEADTAMYAAKEAGRNCIRIFQNL